MRALRRTFSAMKAWERWLICCFAMLLMLSLFMLFRMFYIENTQEAPIRGGTYIEGSVGTIRMLNPWFTVTNDVNRDITSLVFSGLQRYNPFNGKIEDDMAELKISGGNHLYTLTLRDNLFWHDTTEQQPRPVTADDIVFTYQTIKEQGFSNPILQKNFRGVDIEKIDDRTVQFRLEKPYYFFRSNLTLGILPMHRLEGIAPNLLLEALDFNYAPVGSGPYQFKSIVETPLSTEVTLELSPSYYGSTPYIERIVFRAFPDYSSLLSDLKNLDGVRHVPRDQEGKAIIPKRYMTLQYSLPQYVAFFFNLDREILKDEKLRLALQLATNKQEIAGEINESVLIDTPLLEFAAEDWQYQFQRDAAQGALYDSNWHLPEKVRLQHLLENRERNATGTLSFPQPIVLLETGSSLTITGSYVPGLVLPLAVNEVPIEHQEGTTATGSWKALLPTDGSSGSIVVGENFIRLTQTGGKIVDTYVVTRTTDRAHFKRLREEQKIVDEYLERKEDGITIDDLLLEDGALHLKEEDKLHGIRINNDGQKLRLTILTSPLPPTYPKVARKVAEQWRTIGVEAIVEVPEEKHEFEQKVIRREYDVLLFGQPLLDNLDSYPYWHSSQIQVFEEEDEPDSTATSPDREGEVDEEESENVITNGQEKSLRLDANNLSQFTHFKADALLEQIRETHNQIVRQQTLKDLRKVFREQVPAIVLYSPTYVFAHRVNVLGIELGKPSLHSDRFLGLHRWFIREGRVFREGKSWLSFVPWLFDMANGK